MSRGSFLNWFHAMVVDWQDRWQKKFTVAIKHKLGEMGGFVP